MKKIFSLAILVALSSTSVIASDNIKDDSSIELREFGNGDYIETIVQKGPAVIMACHKGRLHCFDNDIVVSEGQTTKVVFYHPGDFELIVKKY